MTLCDSLRSSQLTHVIVEKEKKSSSYKEGRLDTLSDEKTVKIKKFAKEYITKVLRKLDKSKSRQSPSKPSSSHRRDQDRDRGGHVPSGSVPSPEVHQHRENWHEDGDGDGEGDDVEMVMSVEQAMDLGSDSDGEDGPGPDGDADMDLQHSSDEADHDHDPSPMEGVSSHIHPPASVSVTPITPPPQPLQQTLDPRLNVNVKHRSEESGWDPNAIRVANGLNEVHT